VHDEWFADEERVRKVVGFPEKRIEMPNDREVQHHLYYFNSFFNLTKHIRFLVIK
jgi:hypothetical protein